MPGLPIKPITPDNSIAPAAFPVTAIRVPKDHT